MGHRSLVLCWLAFSLAATAARADTASVQVVWRLLDYIAVDYPGAVNNGAVISESEFAEMTEFATTARQRIAELPASSAQPDLQRRAEALQTLIADRASAKAVAAAALSLAADLIKAYPVPLVPVEPLNFARGRTLFLQNCASCHGANGDGNGPASRGLVPPAIAFTDKARARERSIFALYQVIEQGISGTSMASFAGLPPSDRWDLAVYTSAFAYPTSTADEGERIWKEDTALRARTDLEQFIGLTPAALASEIGETKGDAVMAYLRRNPTAVIEPATGLLTRALTSLDEALTAYANGDRKTATDLALSAYLDGFEPVEPILTLRDNVLRSRIETAMGALRACLAQQRPLDEVRQQTAALKVLLAEAEAILAGRNASAGSSFSGAFTILLREGLEAILIVVAMLAFLQKTERRDATRYVHGGWITALAAGALTWGVGTYLVGISGASRELLEGFGSVLAAIILLWVGIWMHGKSNAQAWQRYVCDQMTHALKRRSAWFLFGLSFVVVYREIFETILFYAAIWNHGNARAIVAGGAAAILILSVVAVVMLRYGRTLPIEKFFAYSSGLIALLAVVLTGKGIAALQEAGHLPVHPLATFPRIEILGLFPTLEGIIAPLTMIFFLAIGFTYNHRRGQAIQRPAG
ncbi:MAG TPA: cytochrome c/FTR1 family iron permease [Opitutus sp.]|nr:cytochrome c/FTR1 family iron permease [Opitutus sp.]